MLVVADTSPLNYLVWIGHVDLLPKLFDLVLIPSAVKRELLDRGAPEATRRWASQLPDWVEITEPDAELLNDPAWKGLDPGERAALAVAALRQPIFLLMDENVGRKLAQQRGFLVTGTLGVLDQAARRNLISFEDAVAKLKETSFRYPRQLVQELLKHHAERQRS